MKNSEPVNRNVYMSIELYLAEGSEGNKDLYSYKGSSKATRKEQRSFKIMSIKAPTFQCHRLKNRSFINTTYRAKRKQQHEIDQ